MTQLKDSNFAWIFGKARGNEGPSANNVVATAEKAIKAYVDVLMVVWGEEAIKNQYFSLTGGLV